MSGTKFPYRPPTRSMTQLRVFQEGLAHRSESADKPDWYHTDNGFSSLEVMDRLHGPIVSLAKSKLSNVTGFVLDLGCGNGVLLSKICDGKELIPVGVDINGSALKHAGTILPEFFENFIEGDLFTQETWSMHSSYVMAILMLGRLKEIEMANVTCFITELKKKAKTILVYLYPDWDKTLLEMATELGITLSEEISDDVGLLYGSNR
jgi:hypothetical protein